MSTTTTNTTIKVKSAYLDAEFEAKAYAGDNGEVMIISHTAIDDIVHNKIPRELGVKYDNKALMMNEGHFVMQCTFCDNAGRRAQALGESTPPTLTTQIAQSYPALMAEQRAFDRAAIRFLQFERKVYSNLEIDLSESEETREPKKENVTEPVPPPQQQTAKSQNSAPQRQTSPQRQTTAPQHRAATTQRQTTAPQQSVPMPKQCSGQTPPANVETDVNASFKARATELGKLTYNIGSYRRNPVTLMFLWKNERKSLYWMANEYCGTTEGGKQLKQQCIEFIKLMEAQENG